jgi:hypothetical protein
MASRASVTRNLSFRSVDFPESQYRTFHGIPKRKSLHGTKAMHSVNLDLLQTTPHRADGSARDPHAHHQAEHRARMRAARRAWWQALARIFSAVRDAIRKVARPGHVLPRWSSFLPKYPGAAFGSPLVQEPKAAGSAPGVATGAAVSPPRP